MEDIWHSGILAFCYVAILGHLQCLSLRSLPKNGTQHMTHCIRSKTVPLGTKALHTVSCFGRFFSAIARLYWSEWCCSSLEATNNSVTVTVILSVLCGINYCNVTPHFNRCVFAQAFCSQESFREITLNDTKLR